MSQRRISAYPPDGSVNADLILMALGWRHGNDLWLTQVKNGPTQAAARGELAIIDGLAIAKSWAHPCLTGYEVKVSRSDFLRDTKWPKYLETTNLFSFACPSGLIEPEDIDDKRVGLVWYNPETRALRTVRKPVYRHAELDALTLYYILIARTDSDRHPYFSSDRLALERWVQEKAAMRDLGYAVGRKLGKTLHDLGRREHEVVMAKERTEETAERYRSLCAVLESFGVDRWDIQYNAERALRRFLAGSGGATTQVAEAMERTRAEIDRTLSLLRPAEGRMAAVEDTP